MAYRNKDDVIREAERLGVDIDGLDWQEMQKVVSDAIKREKLGMDEPAPKKQKVRKKKRNQHIDEKLDPYIGKTVYISPEMRPDANRIIRYEEEIGDDLEIEEKTFMAGNTPDSEFSKVRDYATGTFRIKGKTGRKVKAECSLPKENAQIVFRPGIDAFPVVTFSHRSGYLYTHHRLPNFKEALKRSGYFEEYRDKLKGEPNIFYLTGLLCIDPGIAQQIMDEVERKEAHKRKELGYE